MASSPAKNSFVVTIQLDDLYLRTKPDEYQKAVTCLDELAAQFNHPRYERFLGVDRHSEFRWAYEFRTARAATQFHLLVQEYRMSFINYTDYEQSTRTP